MSRGRAFIMVPGLVAILCVRAGWAASSTSVPATQPTSTAAPAWEAGSSDATRRAFVEATQLDRLGLIAVQHDGRLKTLDTLASETLRKISGADHFNFELGQDEPPIRQTALFTLLDMLFEPATYHAQRLIYVKKKPVRRSLLVAAAGRISEEEIAAANRDGRFPMAWLRLPAVREQIEALSRDVVRTAQPIDALVDAARMTQQSELENLLRILPPPRTSSHQQRWFTPAEMESIQPPSTQPTDGPATIEGVTSDWIAMREAWQAQDAVAVNRLADGLMSQLAELAPTIYPPLHKRVLEQWYYRTHKMTWAWVVYLAAVLPLMMGIVYGWPRARRAGAGIFLLAFALHTLAGGIRWYLAGRIPNSNMFEAVTAAAWLGAVLAILFELAPRLAQSLNARRSASLAAAGGLLTFLIAVPAQGSGFYQWQSWGPLPITGLVVMTIGILMWVAIASLRRRNHGNGLLLLGAAVVGMVVMMCGHFMTTSLNSDIGQRMPILNDLWLYIHVNMIIASYALIGIAFVSAAMFVVGRLTIEPTPGLWLSMAIPTALIPLIAMGAGLSPGTVLPVWLPFMIVVFMTLAARSVRAFTRPGTRQRLFDLWTGGPQNNGAPAEQGLGRMLDCTTMLLMELSFLTLWTGIILGAVWADHSWGRPWGWDPKEVFALNTWIIFLILVHVRLKVRDKGTWTAVLAIFGCAVMLFNWIVVNFFITGLHSYA